MGATVKENKNNDLKYRQNMMYGGGGVIGGVDLSKMPDYTNGKPMTEGGNQTEELEYFTE